MQNHAHPFGGGVFIAGLSNRYSKGFFIGKIIILHPH